MASTHFAVLCVLVCTVSAFDFDALKVLNIADKTKHADCRSVLRSGYNVTGNYWLHINNSQVVLPCQFHNGNAYTVVLVRQYNSITFKQPWHAYEVGFGNAHSDFWAGLAHIYALTLQGNNRLQMNLQDWTGATRYVRYDKFYLGDRQSRYRLHVGGFSGNVPDDLSYHNMMPFSTYDAPDPHGCAAGLHAGWWYNYCAYCLPTGVFYHGGPYTPAPQYDGMFWKDWHGHAYSLKYMSMLLFH